MTPLAFVELVGDGFQVLWGNTVIIFLLVVEIWGLGALGHFLWVKKQADHREDEGLAWILSVGIGIFIVSCFAIIAVSRIWASALPILASFLLAVSTIAFAAFLLCTLRDNLSLIRRLPAVPIIIFFFIAIVRLAFLKQLEFPLYYDSADHYQIISTLQNPIDQQHVVCGLERLDPKCYYHLGFHGIVAVVANQLNGGFNTSQLILGIGHTFLILFILNLGLLARRLHNNNLNVGVITMVFAGMGWAMPAFAINWGKYPAMASLAVFPLVVYWIIASLTPKVNFDVRRITVLSVLTSGILLLHSRSVIYLFCALIALATIYYFRNSIFRESAIFFLYVEVLIIWSIAILNSSFREAISPYFQGVDLVITLLAVFLGTYALSQNRHLILGVFAFIVFIAIFSSIPTPKILGNHTGGYFLDRPFIQMSLFAPLSLLAGIGASSLINTLLLHIPIERKRELIAGFLMMILSLTAVIIRPSSSYRPDPCCIYMRVDDVFVIGWLADNLPTQTLVLIAADTSSPNVKVPTDAGAWITPLAEIETIKYDLEYTFSELENYNELCEASVGYIFVSAANASFSIAEIEESKGYYTPIIVLPQTRLYQINCNR